MTENNQQEKVANPTRPSNMNNRHGVLVDPQNIGQEFDFQV
jgi:hypothetical protein